MNLSSWVFYGYVNELKLLEKDTPKHQIGRKNRWQFLIKYKCKSNALIMTDSGKYFNPAVDVRILRSGTDGSQRNITATSRIQNYFCLHNLYFYELWCFGLVFFSWKDFIIHTYNCRSLFILPDINGSISKKT